MRLGISRKNGRESLEDLALRCELVPARPAIDRYSPLVELLRHKEVAGIEIIDVSEERDVGRMRLVKPQQLFHGSHRQRGRLENVFLIDRARVAELRQDPPARIEVGMREEEVDRPVRKPVRSRQRLMVIIAAAAHALNRVEIEARTIASVSRDIVERVLYVADESV